MMSSWFEEFWNENGKKIVFIIIVLCLGSAFMFIDALAETGVVLLTGVSMHLYNMIRSPKANSPDVSPKK